MIVEELYDALIEAGASEEKARAASRAIADMQGHFATIHGDISSLEQRISVLDSSLNQKISILEQKLDQKVSELRSDVDRKISELRSYVDHRFTHIDGTLRLNNWMLATILAFLVAVFFKEFSR